MKYDGHRHDGITKPGEHFDPMGQAASAPEPIWRWPRTLRSRESWRSQKAGASSRFLKLEDSITDTNAMPLSASRSSATIASVLLMNQSNLVAS
jgi:hypothetical protein